MYDAVFDQLPESYRSSLIDLPPVDTVEDRYQSRGSNLLYSAKTGERHTETMPEDLAEEPDYGLLPPVGALVPDHCAVIDVVDSRSWTYPDGDMYTDMALNAFDAAQKNDIPIRYPSNIRDTLEDHYQKQRVDRIMDGLDALGEKLDLDAYQDAVTDQPSDIRGDALIAAAAEDQSEFHESTIVMTDDADFVQLAEDYDIQPLPAVYANRAIRKQ